MEFSLTSKIDNRKKSELLILPFWEKGELAISFKEYIREIRAPIDRGDFSGERGESLWIYPTEGREPRLLLLGLGKKEAVNVENLRLAYSESVKRCQEKRIEKVALAVPSIETLKVDEILEGVCEGVLLTNYVWETLKRSNEETVLLSHVELIGVSSQKKLRVQKICAEADAVYLARDLINGNADEVTPDFLVKVAKTIAKNPKVSIDILRKKELQKEKLGLILAVSRGSAVEPALISLNYNGNPKTAKKTLLVGKGVTYDTGGLSLKTTSGMSTMRDDMSGAACVLATFDSLVKQKAKVNLCVVVPAVENSIDALSYKLGDVYTSYSGHTVEVLNTDAEGRLILADALSWGIDKHKPTQVIDLATLTGSIVRALGRDVAGLFSNCDQLAKSLLKASQFSAEPLWRMPLVDLYQKKVESDIADLKNVDGPDGGSIFAALFLQQFVKDLPWAHLDIAGTAFRSKERGYHPKNGVGFGVRLLFHFFSTSS